MLWNRLSRDQEDIAAIYKRLQFAGVQIFTLGEGEINTLHIGLKGTMNALFLADLAKKTHRGLSGRVEKGKSGGGNSYGYDVVKQFDPHGEPIRGDRTINDVRKNEIKALLAQEQTVDVLIHPGMAVRYQSEINNLVKALNEADQRPRAAELLRSLIDKIVLTPKADGQALQMDLVGDLAGILNVAVSHKTSAQEKQQLLEKLSEMTKTSEKSKVSDEVQVKMVAGADNSLAKSQDKVVAHVRNCLTALFNVVDLANPQNRYKKSALEPIPV